MNVISYPRHPGKEPVTLTPTILEQDTEMGKEIVIYAALAQGNPLLLEKRVLANRYKM